MKNLVYLPHFELTWIRSLWGIDDKFHKYWFVWCQKVLYYHFYLVLVVFLLFSGHSPEIEMSTPVTRNSERKEEKLSPASENYKETKEMSEISKSLA